MSKSMTIDTAASWGASITVPTDGDVFQESQTDVYFDTIADRLGYLKSRTDGLAGLATNNTWTGTQAFNNDITAQDQLIEGQLSFQTLTASGIVRRFVVVTSTSTIGEGYDTVSVGNTAGNITLTMPVAYQGARVRIVRNSTSLAHTVTVQTSTPVTLGVISASAAGWIEVERMAGPANWVVVGYGGTVTSLSTASS